jgi:fucose 4-O-acetylase-like acetyltransferase
MVVLLMRILEGDEASGENSRYPKLSYLEPVGKITLTIYVLHFFVLGVAAAIMDEKPRFDIFTAFSITIAHTLIWIPLANWHQNNIPNLSFEYFLKKIS